jgi:hypothetical protein
MRNNGSNLDDVASISKSLEESNLPLQDCLDDKSIWFLSLCGCMGERNLVTYLFFGLLWLHSKHLFSLWSTHLFLLF